MGLIEADREIRTTIERLRADIRDIEQEIAQLDETLRLLWEHNPDA